MTVLILVSLLQRVSPKLPLPLGSAGLLWHICQYRSQFLSKIRFDLETKIELELQCCIFRSERKLLCPRLGQIVHCFGSTSSIRVPSWSRGIVYSRHKDWFSFPLGDGRAQKNCPFSTNLKPASQHSLDNFWSSDNSLKSLLVFLQQVSLSLLLPCTSARRGCVRISCLSYWPDAAGLPGALWPTGNSLIISATTP